MTIANAEPRLTQPETAALLGVSVPTLIEWARRGWIEKPEKIAGRCLYSVEQLRADVTKNRLRCNLLD